MNEGCHAIIGLFITYAIVKATLIKVGKLKKISNSELIPPQKWGYPDGHIRCVWTEISMLKAVDLLRMLPCTPLMKRGSFIRISGNEIRQAVTVLSRFMKEC